MQDYNNAPDNNAPRDNAAPRSKAGCWVEAARPRTLPVSFAGVVAAVGLTLASGATLKWVPALICALFALLAQIASNFANEYFDYKAGIDRPGRVGPRRGVTEGDITPGAMKGALLATLGLAAVAGCSLIYWGGWWLLGAGAVIMLGALAYSAGPYPLSRHGWGEEAVEVFFGLVPVGLTYYILTGGYTAGVFVMSFAIGLLSANILVVNNYRDIDDDRAAGKVTQATRIGRPASLWLYVGRAVCGVAMTLPLWWRLSPWTLVFPAATVAMVFAVARYIKTHDGAALNPALGKTALTLLFFAATYALCAAATTL
ncbi:MAG: 1,4-dihydroxy-2-naphthoate octaprenyltransferase [[Clostridium] fimetarium]|nr:1,4-dihydroxy-2-naphthoate octaprenyltransferase [Alistipes timonensis]MCM1406817.1 1,4-dihydroxy-2-naphthoate octaprenyltransferase [[Clostridium] fimetarium]